MKFDAFSVMAYELPPTFCSHVIAKQKIDFPDFTYIYD